MIHQISKIVPSFIEYSFISLTDITIISCELDAIYDHTIRIAHQESHRHTVQGRRAQQLKTSMPEC